MSTVVADLQARLSFNSSGAPEVVKDLSNVARAQAAVMKEVESSSAIYQELKLNVVEAARALAELEAAQARVASTSTSTTLAQATSNLEAMERQLGDLNKEMGIFADYQAQGADEFQMQGLVEAYGHTREELQSLIIEQERLVEQGREAVAAFDDQSDSVGDLIRAEADLEQATNRLVAAQEKMSTTDGGMSGLSNIAKEAMADTTTLANAQIVLSRNVEISSASYRQLSQSTADALIHVVNIRNAITDSANAVAASGMSYDQAVAKMRALSGESLALGMEIANLRTSMELLGDNDIVAATEERIEALTSEKEAIDEQLQSAQELGAAYEVLSEGGGALLAAEAKLESQTIKLDKAQRDAVKSAEAMGESAADMGGSLEQSAGAMRSSSTRMNYYIQALANGNITQTLIGQSGAIAAQGVQKLNAALAAGGTVGQKFSNVGNLVATSMAKILTPTTAVIVAVGAAVALWMKAKKEQEEFARATYAAARAMEDQTKTLHEQASGLARSRIESQMLFDEMQKAGVSVADFVQALSDPAMYDSMLKALDASVAFNDSLDELKGTWADGPFVAGIAWIVDWVNVNDDAANATQATRDALEDLRTEMEVGAIMAKAFQENQERINEGLLKTADYATLMSKGLVGAWESADALAQRMGDLDAIISLIAFNDLDMLKVLQDLDVSSVEELVGELERLSDVYPQLKGVISVLNSELSKEAQQHRDAAAAIREHRNAAREAVDAGFALTQSVKRLYDAQVAYDQASTPENAFAYADALRAVQWAAQELPGGMAAAIEYVNMMTQQGYFSTEMAAQLIQYLQVTGQVAADLGGQMVVTAAAVQAEGDAAAAAAGSNGALAGSTGGVTSGMYNVAAATNTATGALYGYIGALSQVATAKAIAGSGGRRGTRSSRSTVMGGTPTMPDFMVPNVNSGALGGMAGFSPSGGGSGGSGGGGGSSGGTTDDKGLAIEEIKKFFQQVNKAIKAGIDGGVLYSDAGNAVPVGGPQDFIASEGGVNIQTVNLRGVWDFADPAAKREIVRQLQEALAQFEKEVS